MKKLFITILSALILISCENSNKDNKKSSTIQETTNTSVENSLVKNLDYETFITKIWNFETHPDSFAYQSELPCMIDFFANWCGPCKRVAPIMESIAQEYEGKLIVYKVNVDKEKKLSTILKIKNIPTVYFIPAEGNPLFQSGALSKEEYISIINKHLIN